MGLVELLTRWGVLLVFGAALMEQAGLPLPAAAVLVSAGALAESGALRAEFVLVAAFLGCFIADQAWFFVGRRYGRGVLAGLCRLSLSPDTCVRNTDDRIARHGAAVLLGAKFVPGVSAVAVPTAAAMGLSYRRFVLFDGLGCALWSGVYLGVGMIFGREVNRLLDWMSLVGGRSVAVLSALFVLYIGWKILHRFRLRRLHRLIRISPHEIATLLERDPDLLILDARSSLARAQDPRTLPRHIVVGDRAPSEVLPADARRRTIVTFCTCPNEASAALMAEQLIKAGYERVRVLTGGTDALEILGRESASGFEDGG